MISAGDFRNGITIEYENSVYQIIEFQHVKPGGLCQDEAQECQEQRRGREILPPYREVPSGPYR